MHLFYSMLGIEPRVLCMDKTGCSNNCVTSSALQKDRMAKGVAKLVYARMHIHTQKSRDRDGGGKKRVCVHTHTHVCLSQLCPPEGLRAWTLIKQRQDISDHVGAETLCHTF